MYISLNWLKKYVDIPKGFLAADLAAKLTACTVEVEGWKKEGELLDNVVVGKILEIKDHPNADKLKLVVVDIGKKKTEVVCGGTNLKKGMLVALAKIGARVNWHGAGQIEELKPVKIRGVESQGMICLSSEIGLQDIMPDKSDTEILDLSHLKLKVGQPLAEALHLDDTILEIDNKSLTHRPDLWGHYGLARELAAILKVKFKNYDPKEIKGGRGKNLKVEIKDKEKCRRYIGVVVDNVKIAPSPDWLVRQLESVGVRAINNIVDITNYVMLELGEPMHSFDWREIKGGTIIIDTAQKGEKFTTLDGQERILDEQMLLIKDGKRAVALAGVMGGLNSEIKDDTVTILFEAANFEPNNIRKTSIKLGLRTEGSARWEKNLSPVIAELAMRKAVEMTLELSPGAKVASKVIDQNFYTSQISEIELDLNWLNKRLGTAVAKEEVIGILERLQFEVKDKKNSLIVKVPYWRSTKDVSIAEDLVEEIARIYGYDNIKPTMPSAPVAPPKANLERVGERKVKEIFTLGLGFTEVSNYSFVNLDKVQLYGLSVEDHIKLKNYLSIDQSALRTTLIPNLVNNVVDNQRFFDRFQIFELGLVFSKKVGTDLKGVGSDIRLPLQDKYLAGVVSDKNATQPFYAVKGALASLFDQLCLDYYFEPAKDNIPPYADRTRIMTIKTQGQLVGHLGELDPTLLKKIGIIGRVGFFEINFSQLAGLIGVYQRGYQSLPKFPSVTRDLAIVVDQQVEWEKIKKMVKKIGGVLIKDVQLFDVYQGGKIETGKRSLAFHILYQADERTLEAEEVNKVEAKIIQDLNKQFGAVVR